MAKTWMDVFKSEIDEVRRKDLYEFVQDGDMAIERAAKRANISVEEFRTEMKRNGYKELQIV